MLKRLVRSFSLNKVPVFDISQYLRTSSDPQTCFQMAEAFHLFGCIALIDPRVDFSKNEKYLDLMEEYFIKRAKLYYQTGELRDNYPETGYESGITQEKQETAREHSAFFEQLRFLNKAKGLSEDDQNNMPVSPLHPIPDAKWRYMLPIGKPRKSMAFNDLDPQHKNPEDFPQFTSIGTQWGEDMLKAVNTVSEMSAIGLGLPKDIFTKKIKGAHTILAPTGSDLIKNGPGTIFAGLHYDFNFMTIHGKNRFPGLYIWLRTGEKIPVKIPDGAFLLQSGRQFEIVTGGYVMKGFHEVVYNEECRKKVEEQKKKGKKDIWRVSSTMFVHCASDEVLKPEGKFATKEALEKYPATTSYKLKEEELKAIGLLAQTN